MNIKIVIEYSVFNGKEIFMPDLEKLLGAARKSYMPDNSGDTCEAIREESINKDSSRSEILDFIMVFLCERIDLKYSAFKGGYVLTKLMPDDARATEDIDFSVSTEGQYYDIIPVLTDLGEHLTKLGIITSYEVKPTIGEHSSGGITMQTDGNTKNLKIDIGWHDLSWGIANWSCEGFECRRFEVERMLADKISAIYSRKRFRRTKDIYDFYILTNNFDVDMEKLRKYVELRGLIDWSADPFREVVMVEYGKAYNALKVATVKGEAIQKPPFDIVIGQLQSFMNKYETGCKWNHLTRTFS